MCPFIPVRNVTMEDCVKCAKQVAETLAEELKIPSKLRVIGRFIDVFTSGLPKYNHEDLNSSHETR